MKRRDLLKGIFGGAVAGVAGFAGKKLSALEQTAEKLDDKYPIGEPTIDLEFDESKIVWNSILDAPIMKIPNPKSEYYRGADYGPGGDFDFCDPDLSKHEFFRDGRVDVWRSNGW